MSAWKTHLCKIAKFEYESDTEPNDGHPDEITPSKCRQQIEPWLSAIFQSEHLSLLIGNGLTKGTAKVAGIEPAEMSQSELSCSFASQIDNYAEKLAEESSRGDPNIEDQIHAAQLLASGLAILGDKREKECRQEVNSLIGNLLKAIIAAERHLDEKFPAEDEKGIISRNILCSFILSFASRTVTRERLHIFTTNYDRLIEYACDWIGLHIIDRFVGSVIPIFRASRFDIDIHYNPPGIRGEPRYLEGVIKLTKLHGSVDWRYENRILKRTPLPFGASEDHTEIPDDPADTVIVYPNPAKDMETCQYPYSELFRDFSAAICRPNAALVTYGYGFGDGHINRIIRDMLTLPSAHLVIISYDDPSKRISNFYREVGHAAQISLLIGKHFGDIENLVQYYLPKPAIDRISIREARLRANRGEQENAQDKRTTGSNNNSTQEGD